MTIESRGRPQATGLKSTPEIRNAVIEEAEIHIDDHGILTAWVTLDYGDSGHQGFGGYFLYSPSTENRKNYTGLFLWRTMEVVGVSRWSDLVGKTIRVKSTREKVEAIGHIVKKDWFNPSAELKRLEGEGG